VIVGTVSAYLLARGTEVAIVDTGNPGSAPVIEQSLSTIGLGWSNVGHVILTHLHPDHIGSLGPVMDSASTADGYAGEADISAMSASPRPIIAVGDDDQVFGLDIIETPGHTAGHISVLDSVGGLLVAGDALFGEGGGVVVSLPRFTSDLAQADESVKKMANFQFDTVVFGHGDPIVVGADAAVAALAASL
jgi:glyoxylase-like metal-dependent hydrolase (beta-lactamase superfamily II)